MREESGALSVSAVSLLLSIPVPTIRSWERRYGFPRPARTRGAHRRYSYRDIDQLRALRDEIASGVPAAEAVAAVRARITDEGRGDWVPTIVKAGLDYDTVSIRSQLEQSALDLGLDGAIERVVLPVLREIGTMWQAGQCDVAQEHVSSQAIRTWLSARLATFPKPDPERSVLLACGPLDVHSIGLEAFYVMLTRRRVTCRFLGAQTPATSLSAAVASTSPHAVVMTSHLAVNRRAAVAALRELRPSHTAMFYAGNAFTSSKARRGVPGDYLGRNLAVAADRVADSLVA